MKPFVTLCGCWCIGSLRFALPTFSDRIPRISTNITIYRFDWRARDGCHGGTTVR
ncbi:hypothetical protein PR003_g25326 [Phytophthora rubi]|uniref:Uncharacterized protein n=1 Tax=Phytophthora rubi TaxID=129364 RepID=A0A6A3J2D4_9STRA|nr:hypothetical protein PR002_g23254 [Phytophthora rubi]KAE8986414.1 hypothetical protein PR001_g22608 [Phytophthora rubi]KAE9290315.1 hypothetical protein PR003_g25326 [Phytophthora rubi]